ncbi:MAG TPA: YicC/YloC family endoribonuclease [Bacteroidota bacterium]|nr:YicC/YloC family endoribonuclease [Bacteroidota bacterium]
MTGYGRGEASGDGITAVAEVRSVNSRFLEVSSRLPRMIGLREPDVRDLLRTRFSRGKVSVVIAVEHDSEGDIPLGINIPAAKEYYKLLNTLRKAVKIQEKISLDHLLKFSEILEVDEQLKQDDQVWAVAQRALRVAIDEAANMRMREGEELKRDLFKRVNGFGQWIQRIEEISQTRSQQEMTRLRDRIAELVRDPAILNEQRLELEIAILADRLDVTEECVRFRSHVKFFLEAADSSEAAGRKLNFLIQEMNREANTVGSKSSDVEIAHIVVGIKEELEKVREQLQNIE